MTGGATPSDTPGGAALETILTTNATAASNRQRIKTHASGSKNATPARHPTSTARPAATAPRGRAYRTFGVGPIQFRLPDADSISACISTFADYAVYILGPVLICLATAIICGLTYTFFVIILPMLAPDGPFTQPWLFHVSIVVFFLTNVIWNYVLCVCTSNKGRHYDRVVRELADTTGFRYPETEAEVAQCKREYREKMLERGRARRRHLAAEKQREQNQLESGTSEKGVSSSSAAVTSPVVERGSKIAGKSITSPAASAASGVKNGSSSTTRIFSWMLMAPDEWGFCNNTNQPKPPRSHYDHVTKMLVLNMDHYCPWMFNTVGYFNYRYFCNFLFYVFTGMLYGTFISFHPFREMSSSNYYKQIEMNRTEGYKTYKHMISNVPLPSERTPIAFSFMLCLSVGIAVFCLMVFHLYLVLSAQTTIEFHGNWGKRRQARRRGRTWINPYDLGSRRNWQQVYGTQHPVLAMLPSRREPEFFPLPIAGEKGRRHPKGEHIDLSLEMFGGDKESNHKDKQKNGNMNRNGLAHLV
eukprot:CAMPEP_0113547232 /NCGR_PEP_ID=MMETSP0015_2-20120614/12242_1 /TAXON_ID=2838 /ORGANISM="Odontella" /LENGTH=529 /DNA_ID=CAMNT_0000447765 /DNA_START=10 /DNA_END=1599 /DNA_ORIENTATION=- /assembly_acc=CAM_ASM_000160